MVLFLFNIQVKRNLDALLQTRDRHTAARKEDNHAIPIIAVVGSNPDVSSHAFCSLIPKFIIFPKHKTKHTFIIRAIAAIYTPFVFSLMRKWTPT